MKDPVRWKDDDDVASEIRELLGHGATPPALDDGTRRSTAAFAASLGTGTAAAATGAGVSGLKLAIGLLAVATVGGGAWLAANAERGAVEASLIPAAARGGGGHADTWREEDDVPAESPEPAFASAGERVAAATVRADEEESTGRAEDRASPGHRAATPSATPVAERRGTSRVRSSLPAGGARARTGELAPAPSVDPLTAEAALLEQARALLGSDPRRTLALADQHAHEHAGGQLGAERELIAVDALLRLGRRAEAERRTEALIARAPHGMYAQRVRRMLERAAER